MSKLHTLRGLTELFSPNAVAVVGASPKPGSVGGVILNNIKAGGFQRPIYVVHPTATTVHGFAAYPSIAAIKEHVDLAVIVIPAQHVNSVARECGKKVCHICNCYLIRHGAAPSHAVRAFFRRTRLWGL